MAEDDGDARRMGRERRRARAGTRDVGGENGRRHLAVQGIDAGVLVGRLSPLAGEDGPRGLTRLPLHGEGLAQGVRPGVPAPIGDGGRETMMSGEGVVLAACARPLEGPALPTVIRVMALVPPSPGRPAAAMPRRRTRAPRWPWPGRGRRGRAFGLGAGSYEALWPTTPSSSGAERVRAAASGRGRADERCPEKRCHSPKRQPSAHSRSPTARRGPGLPDPALNPT